MAIAPVLFFFFNDTATTEIYTLSLHDALPIYFTNFMSKLVIPANAKAMVTVNYGSNPSGTDGADPEEAADWVRFANLTKNYGIEYWEIGNEIFGNGIYGAHWEMDLHSNRTPVTYGNNAALFSRAMKSVDPSIKIGVVLTTPGYWPDAKAFNWNRTVLQHCGKNIDFVIVHYYPDTGNVHNGGAKVLSMSSEIPRIASRLRSLIGTFCGTNAPNVKLAVTEAGQVNYTL